jgi:hypothetical protein
MRLARQSQGKAVDRVRMAGEQLVHRLVWPPLSLHVRQGAGLGDEPARRACYQEQTMERGGGQKNSAKNAKSGGRRLAILPRSPSRTNCYDAASLLKQSGPPRRTWKGSAVRPHKK